jgi:hypothetical protein
MRMPIIKTSTTDSPELRGIASALAKQINTFEFFTDARLSITAFSRSGKLGFVNVMDMVLAQCIKVMDLPLDDLFDQSRFPQVTANSFLEARSKIKWQAFKTLLDMTVEEYVRHINKAKTDSSLFVLAVESTIISLANFIANRQEFGASGYPSARLSVLVDTSTGTVLDLQFAPLETASQTMAIQHFKRLAELGIADTSIIIPDHDLLKVIGNPGVQGTHFIFQVKNNPKEIDDLPQSSDTNVSIASLKDPITIRVAKYYPEELTLVVDKELTPERLSYAELKQVFESSQIPYSQSFMKQVIQHGCFTRADRLSLWQDVFATSTVWNIATFRRNSKR